MQLCKVQVETAEVHVGAVRDDHIHFLNMAVGWATLSDILHAERPAAVARDLLDDTAGSVPIDEVDFLAPIDAQEVWAAGVTYKRSQEARERESVGAAKFYDLVYSAERPELFFKATPHRVSHPGGPVRVRHDSKWSVPEPELALVLSPKLEIVGYTIGN